MSWLRATLLVVLGLGGLAGCAPLTEVATPEPGRSLDGVRQEVAQLRAETVQLGSMLRQVEDGLRARNATLVQLGERLQALEKDVPPLKRPSSRRGVLPAPAGRGGSRPGGHELQVGMSPDAVRALLGAPLSLEETPDFLFWHYGPEQTVVFRRDTAQVHGWLGFAP